MLGGGDSKHEKIIFVVKFGQKGGGWRVFIKGPI